MTSVTWTRGKNRARKNEACEVPAEFCRHKRMKGVKYEKARARNFFSLDRIQVFNMYSDLTNHYNNESRLLMVLWLVNETLERK